MTSQPPDWAAQEAREVLRSMLRSSSAIGLQQMAQSLREAYRRGVDAAAAVAAEHACTDTVEGRTGRMIVEGIHALKEQQ